ncbi:MAG: alpha/beta fold hydrolase [Ktedonobacterales bacterium]
MENPRIYGAAPYTVAVVHGGPGAPGTMAPVARELASNWGVLEPLQTATTLDGQIEELRNALDQHGDLPMTLIGSSWGAMLSYLLAARHPALVRKLILIGSGVYEDRYAAGIEQTRLSRLSADERIEAQSLTDALADPTVADKSVPFARLGAMFTRTDAYDPFTLDTEVIEVQYPVYQQVWPEVQALRASGALLEAGKHIQCPVVAIHGDYDPHPAEGIREPLARILTDFRFIPLQRCGHLPWIECHAHDDFFRILLAELLPFV